MKNKIILAIIILAMALNVGCFNKKDNQNSKEETTTQAQSEDINNSSESIQGESSILQYSEIKEGDVILTSGLGMIYPKEIRIGEVVSVETDNVMVMKNAIVKPYVDFNKLEELFVVVPKDKINVKYD